MHGAYMGLIVYGSSMGLIFLGDKIRVSQTPRHNWKVRIKNYNSILAQLAICSLSSLRE